MVGFLILYKSEKAKCLHNQRFLYSTQNRRYVGQFEWNCLVHSTGSQIRIWQVEMGEAFKPLTVFTMGQFGFYKCDCMPFGLVNALATFQRLMETCFGDLQQNWCLNYLDMVAFSKHWRNTWFGWEQSLGNWKEVGLKLKPSKCEFFKKSLTYLGHRILENGIETDNSKIKVIKEWPLLRQWLKVEAF